MPTQQPRLASDKGLRPSQPKLLARARQIIISLFSVLSRSSGPHCPTSAYMCRQRPHLRHRHPPRPDGHVSDVAIAPHQVPHDETVVPAHASQQHRAAASRPDADTSAVATAAATAAVAAAGAAPAVAHPGCRPACRAFLPAPAGHVRHRHCRHRDVPHSSRVPCDMRVVQAGAWKALTRPSRLEHCFYYPGVSGFLAAVHRTSPCWPKEREQATTVLPCPFFGGGARYDT